MPRFLIIAALLAGMTGVAVAGVVTTPEIDATSGAAAIALVCGGVLVLRARKNKKK